MNLPPTLVPQYPVPVARYRFTAIARQDLQLPDYAGSLLRGQFGASLRQVACMTRQPTCVACPLLQTCPYSRVFEAPAPPKGAHPLQDFSQIPNPYVIEPPTPGARLLVEGDSMVFHMVLVGHALGQLPLIVFALQRALAHGLTRARAVAELACVELLPAHGDAQPIWSRETAVLADHLAQLQVPPAPPGLAQVRLDLRSPLRLQHQGRPLGVGEATPRALIATLVRRVGLLMQFHAGQTAWSDSARTTVSGLRAIEEARDLRWHDWTRFSSRQRQEMTLGGLLGQWTLMAADAHVLTTLWPWLWLGQWLHVGKNATMGLGHYTLTAAAPDPH